MDKTISADDVISISSSSDNDSDCRIVKVVSSSAKRDKNKMRWQYQPRSMPRARASRRDREGISICQQDEEAVYEDRRDVASTTKGDARRFKPESMATSSGATRNGRRFQGASQNIESLQCGSKVDRLSDTGSNNAKVNSRAVMSVDLTDPFSLQQCATDLEETGAFPPLLLRHVKSKQADDDDEDDERLDMRARSCSTATLDLSTAAQLRGSRSFERDVRGTTDVLVEPSESLPNVSTELTDSTKSMPPSADSIVHISNGHTPSRELNQDIGSIDSGVANSNICARNGKVSLNEEAASHQVIRIQLPSPIPQQQRSPPLQPLNKASTRAHRQLPRVGKWRTWSSAINFVAFEALPGPLFTRPKEVLHPMTYDGMMKERAEKEARKRKRSDEGG